MSTQNTHTTSTSGQQAGGIPIEDQIISLTAQALNGNTVRNRHLALVQLLTKLDAANGNKDDLVCAARDSAIKHSHGLTDVIAALLVGTPLPPRSDFDEADVLPVGEASCPINVEHAEDHNDPPDVSIETIAEHMAHFPEWETALLTRRANFGERDPLDVKNRMVEITDYPERYAPAARQDVAAAYESNDLDALSRAVEAAEKTMVSEAAPITRGRVEPETLPDEPEETDSGEVLKLCARIAELEAEVDLWKRQPWDLKHSEPRGKPGRRRGESEFDEILDDLQVKLMVEHIGENTTGPGCVGAVLMLIEHIGGLAFAKRFNDLDMAIDHIRDGLLSGDYMKDHSAESLRELTTDYSHDWIEFHFTSGIQNLSEDYQRYTDRRKAAKYADR